MAKEVIWSTRALEDRIEILDYWKRRTHSSTYSRKLNGRITLAVKLLAQFPHMGVRTEIENVRVKYLDGHSLVYEIWGDRLIILAMWHERRDPEDFLKLAE